MLEPYDLESYANCDENAFQENLALITFKLIFCQFNGKTFPTIFSSFIRLHLEHRNMVFPPSLNENVRGLQLVKRMNSELSSEFLMYRTTRYIASSSIPKVQYLDLVSSNHLEHAKGCQLFFIHCSLTAPIAGSDESAVILMGATVSWCASSVALVITSLTLENAFFTMSFKIDEFRIYTKSVA